MLIALQTGYKFTTKETKVCDVCSGFGGIEDPRPGQNDLVPCRRCDGTGNVEEERPVHVHELIDAQLTLLSMAYRQDEEENTQLNPNAPGQGLNGYGSRI